MKTNQVNEVLEKIREVCDLKRLEFGAIVEFNGILRDVYATRGDKKEVYIQRVMDFAWVPVEKCKIIGLPVQLNHLLLALGIDQNELNCGQMSGSFTLGIKILAMYDYKKSVEDNLRSNPELTKWVHGVIID